MKTSQSVTRALSLLCALFTVAVVGSSSGCGDDGGSSSPDLARFVQEAPPDMACVSACTTNAQCQNSCGPPSSGISCCDATTNTCFTSNTTSCPAPPMDMSVVGPY